MHDKWKKMNRLDGLICPVYPVCAFLNSESKDLASVPEYCYLWNILDYPAGTVPITEVQGEEDEEENF